MVFVDIEYAVYAFEGSESQYTTSTACLLSDSKYSPEVTSYKSLVSILHVPYFHTLLRSKHITTHLSSQGLIRSTSSYLVLASPAPSVHLFLPAQATNVQSLSDPPIFAFWANN